MELVLAADKTLMSNYYHDKEFLGFAASIDISCHISTCQWLRYLNKHGMPNS